MDEYTQARCRAATNAALLVCLKEQPAAPKENTYMPDSTTSDLSLQREVQLLDEFAFISSMKNDPNGVTAVCMEIEPGGAGLILRVAANTGSLAHVAGELQAVADIMMKASRHGMCQTAEFNGPC